MEDNVSMEHDAHFEARQIGRAILRSDIMAALEDWHNRILDSGCKYVVFVVRRCYLLELYMVQATGRSMEKEGDKVFLTDASSYLRCEELANYYREHRSFPRILFVDDILIHGRNLNRLISDMENRICSILEEGEAERYSIGAVQEAFLAAVEIQVFARARENLLLWEKYERKLRYIRPMEIKEWREFSSQISMLILSADIANAVYVFSQHITDEEFSRISGQEGFQEFEESAYQNIRQFTSVRFWETRGRVQAVYTIRIVKNMLCEGYRVIPFVFIPDLDVRETESVMREVQNILPPAEGEWLEELKKIEGMRSYNELLSLILSHGLLQEFNQDFGIVQEAKSESWELELDKLARNYDSGDLEGTREHLRNIIETPLYKKRELDDLLSKCISGENCIVEVSGEGEALTSEERKKLLSYEENYFYGKGRKAEVEAYEYSQLPYISNKKRVERFARKVPGELKRLFSGFSRRRLKTGFVYFLQLMDSGILGINSIAPRDSAVTGYSQFVKYGEMSLLIPTIRLYEYIPLLTMMERKCRQKGWDMKEELESFSRSSHCVEGLNADKVEEIETYMGELKEVDQRIEDWSGNYYLRKASYETEAGTADLIWLVNFKRKQKDFVDAYVEYMEDKKR